VGLLKPSEYRHIAPSRRRLVIYSAKNHVSSISEYSFQKLSDKTM